MLVSFEKKLHNITVYCCVAHLERQDCNLVLNQTFNTLHFQVWEQTSFGIHIWNLRTARTRFPSSFWNAEMEASVYIFSCLTQISEVRGRDLSITRFQISVLARIVLVLGSLHFLVYDLSRFIKETLQLWLFCSANLQPVNLWTWLNSTGAQHWKVVWAAPHFLMEWEAQGQG